MTSSWFHEPRGEATHSVACILKWLALLPRTLRLRNVRLEILSPDGSSTASLHYVCETESLDYLKDLLQCRELETETFPVWRCGDKIQSLQSRGVIVVMEINRLLRCLVPPGSLITFPWIRHKVHLKEQTYRERRGKIEATFGRKVRQNQFQFRTTQNLNALRQFYDDFYAPYIEFRFGSLTHLRSLAELRTAVQHGFLLQVFDGDLWISGAVCAMKGRTLTMTAIGLLPDYQEQLRRGAMSAAYYFMFQWAEANGIETLDLLRTRPHRQEGSFEHKRKWGGLPMVDLWPHTSLHFFVPANTPIPPPLQQLLIWTGENFEELQNLRCP